MTIPIPLQLPVTAEAMRRLRVGDEVLVSGRIVTAREAAHRLLVRGLDPRLRALLEGRLVYHCGPVVAPGGAGEAWRVVAAGPTPSIRMEPWEAELLAGHGVRGVLGRGGMGPRTLAAFAQHGGAYLHVARGLAVTLARHVTRVHAVHLLDELGTADALWDLEVRSFPAVVTMDAHGGSLHEPGAAASLPGTSGGA